MWMPRYIDIFSDTNPRRRFFNLDFFTPSICQCHTQRFLGLPVHISTVYWSATEGPHCGLGCCQKFLQNLKYLNWFKMHFPSWSFDKPFSKKFGLDIWMSTLIQQYKNRHAYDTDCPWWVRSNPIIFSFLNLSIFKYITYSTCCLFLFFLLNMCSLSTSLFSKFLVNFQCVASSCITFY